MAVMGSGAGVDVFLACNKPEVIVGLHRALVLAAEKREIRHDDLLAAETRATTWRDRFYASPVAPSQVKTIVGCGSHLTLAQEIEERAAQLV